MNIVHAATIKKEATPLENDLMAFVESHPEVFSPVASMQRNIIRAFGMMDGTRGHMMRLGVGGLFDVILTEIATKITKGINTSQDVNDALVNFELCIEFIDKFSKNLIDNEPAFEMKDIHFRMRFWSSLVKPPIPAGACTGSCSSVSLHVEHSIWGLTKYVINDYNSRVLKLWADFLIKQNKIDPTAMQERMRTVPDAPAAIVRTFGDPANMNLETLLNVLTFIHLTEYFPCSIKSNPPLTLHQESIQAMIQRKQALRDLFFTHGDGLLVNRFVKLNDNGISNRLIGTHVENDLNEMELRCNVIGTAQSLPVQAYLSSDILDQCVQSVGHFPTTDEFIKYMSTRMIKKAAAFSAPPPPPPPPASAPPLEELDGGKRTRRKMDKNKRKHSNKSRHHRR